MVFMKTSHGMQKCHKSHFLEYNEGQLELVFGDNFADYIWMYLQNATLNIIFSVTNSNRFAQY